MSTKTLAGISAAAILSILAGNAYAEQMYVNKLNGTAVIPNATYGSITVGNSGIYATEYATRTSITSETINAIFDNSTKIVNHTISGWFNVGALPASGSIKDIFIAASVSNLGHAGGHDGYKVSVDENGKLLFGKINDSFTWQNQDANDYVTSSSAVSANTWFYLTISVVSEVDGNNKYAIPTFYVNGANVTDAETTKTKCRANLNGNGGGCKSLHISAGISAAGIYVDNTALTAATIDKATSEDYVSPVTREILDLHTITIDAETELDLSSITLPEGKDVLNIKVVVPAEKAVTITGTKPAAVPGALQLELNGEVTMTPALSATLGAVTGTGTLKIANADTGTSSSQHPTAAALTGFTGTVEISAGRIEAQSNFSHANMTIKVVDGAQLSAGNTGAWACKFNLSGDGWDHSSERNRYAITKAALRLNGNVTGAITVEGEGVAIGTYNSTLTLSGAITAANGLKVICEDGGNITLSAANNSIAGLDVVGAGIVTGGAANALGSGEITVRTGASVVTQQYDGNTGYSVTLDGGTLKSKGAVDAHGKLVKNLTLTKDSSYVWTNDGAGSGLIGIGQGGSAECSLALGGHTLTLTGKDANTRVYLDKTTITSAGTINVTQGKLFLHCSSIEMPAGSKLVIGESASIEADTVTLTVPELVYNGTATSTSGDMCNVTVTDKYSGTGTIPKLTLADGATIEVSEVPEDKVVVKASNTLTANVATLKFMVGGEASELTLEKVGNTIVAGDAGGTYDCTSVTSTTNESGCWYEGHNTDKWTINVPAFTGHLPGGAHIYATLNLGGDWLINDGYNGSTATIDKLTGAGNLTVSKDFGLAKRYTVIINDVSEYTGDISIGGTIVITLPNSYTETVTGAVAKKVGETMTDYYSTVDLALTGKTPGDDVSDITILADDATLPAAWSSYKIVEGKIVAKTATELFLEGIAAGGEVALTGDVTLTSAAVIPADKTVTLDLNGHTITASGTTIKTLGILTIKDTGTNGAVVSTGHAALAMGDNGSLTIESGSFTGVEGAIIFGKTSGATVTINDGTFTATDNAVIASNGTAGCGSQTLTINGGAFNGGITSAGYIACGIYWANTETATINGGTFNITGGCGICARAGNVKIGSDVTINLTNEGSVSGKVGDSKNAVPGVQAYFDYAANYPALAEGAAITSANKLTIADTQEWVGETAPYTLADKPTGPQSWTDVKDVTTVLPEGTTTTVTTDDLVKWAEDNEVEFVAGITIPVNALILNCAPNAEILNDVKAAADKILEDYLKEATKEVDLATLLKEIPEGGKEISIEGYPMATIKLVPATLGEEVVTSANLFKLELNLK